MTVQPKPSREGRWRWALWALALVLVLAGGAAIVLGPALLPEETLRREVEAALSAEVGRPVTIESARLGWVSGLVLRQVTIASASPGGPPLARAKKVQVRLGPLDALAAAAGAGVTPDLVRLDGLELHLVQDRQGRWNAGTIAARAPAGRAPRPQPRAIQVARATVHIRNEALGRELVVADIHGSFGQLASTGQAYLSASARLVPPPGGTSGTGRVTVTASLSSTDLAARDRLSGSLKAEWQDVSWSAILAAVTTVPPVARLVGRTSGNVSATFDRGAWQAEGAIEADEVALAVHPEIRDLPPGEEAGAKPDIIRAVLGFQVAQAGPTKPIDLGLAKITVPGITLQATGRVHREKSGLVRPDLRVEGDVAWGPLSQSVEPVRRFAARFERFGGSTGLDLHLTGDAKAWRATGTLDLTNTHAVHGRGVWKESAQPCRLDFAATLLRDRTAAVLERLEVTTRAGKVELAARVPLAASGAPVPELASLVLRANLTRTEALVELVPALAHGLGGVGLAGPMKADLALTPASPQESSEFRFSSSELQLANPQSEIRNPQCFFDAVLRASLTDLEVVVPGGPRKAPRTRMEVRAAGRVGGDLAACLPFASLKGGRAATGRACDLSEAPVSQSGATEELSDGGTEERHNGLGLVPSLRRSATPSLSNSVAMSVDLRSLHALLDRATVTWTGTASLGRPAGADNRPEGRLDGRLVIETLESLAALAAPKHFVAIGDPGAPAETLPLAGDVGLSLQATLRGGELRGRAEASLTKASLRLAGPDPPHGPLEPATAGRPRGQPSVPYFFKAAGRSASAVVDGRCIFGDPNFLDARWTFVLPGLRAEATSQMQFAVAIRPAARNAERGTRNAEPIRNPESGIRNPESEIRNPKSEIALTRALIVQAGPMARLKVEAALEDLERALGLVPAAATHLASRARGAGSASVEWFTVPGKISIKGEANLTAAALDFGAALRKAPETPLHVSASAEATTAAGPGGEAGLLCQTQLRAHLGDSTATATGQVGLATPPSLAAAAPLLAARPLDWALALVRSADLEVEAAWQNGPALEGLVPALRPLYRQCQVSGPAQLKARVLGTPQGAAVRILLDAAHCRIRQPGYSGRPETVFKEAGMPANLALEARWGQVPGELVLERAALVLSGLKAEATGRLLFDDPVATGDPPTLPAAWVLRIKGSMPDLAALNAGLPADLRLVDPTGGVQFDVAAAGDPMGMGLERCDLVLERAGLKWLGRTVRLDGPVAFDAGRLVLGGAGRRPGEAGPGDPAPEPGLRIVVGESDLMVAGEIAEADRRPRGSLLIRGRRVSVDEVQQLLEQTARSPQATTRNAERGSIGSRVRGIGSGGTTPDPRPKTLPFPVPGSGFRLPSSELRLRRVERLLARADVAVALHIGLVTLTVPALEAVYDLTDLRSQARLAEGRFTVPSFRCGLNDGTVVGQLAVDLQSDPPRVSVAYEAKDLAARENLKPMIDLTFPGLECRGRVTQRESKIVPIGGEGYPVGHGEVVLVDGILTGPAAPEYMQRIFPGLRLTTYPYHKMSNLFERQADGTVQNRMIFDGKRYDIFIFGYTRADGVFEYTQGVDLSVSLGSQTWSRTLDQGKVPLMVYTGRIVGKEYAERHIRYVAPHELAYDAFVKRNLVVKLLTSLGEKPPDLSKPPALPENKE